MPYLNLALSKQNQQRRKRTISFQKRRNLIEIDQIRSVLIKADQKCKPKSLSKQPNLIWPGKTEFIWNWPDTTNQIWSKTRKKEQSWSNLLKTIIMVKCGQTLFLCGKRSYFAMNRTLLKMTAKQKLSNHEQIRIKLTK